MLLLLAVLIVLFGFASYAGRHYASPHPVPYYGGLTVVLVLILLLLAEVTG